VKDDAGAVTTTVMRDEKTKEALTCDAKKKCAKGSKCVYSQSMVGSWSMDLKGGEDPANWFCGFQNFGAATAAMRVQANGAAVWSLHALGCRGKWCQKRVVDRLFTLRSVVSRDANKDTVVDAKDYECLYFPNTFVGQATSPSRVPKMGSHKTPSDVFGWKDEDGSTDPDCGIRLSQTGKCRCVTPDNTVLPKIKTQKKCTDGNHWVCSDLSPFSQERALIANKQATWKLTFLQEFDA